MHDVRSTFSAAGCQRVRTVIQSGNVLFEPPAGSARAILERIRGTLRTAIGEEPEIVLRTVHDLEAVIAAAPFKDAAADPGIKLYVAFLARKPRGVRRLPLILAKEGLEAVAIRGRDVFIISRRKKNGFFGFPNNFIEDELGVAATTRNWSTVRKIVEAARR